jgi:hypothetical protein
MVAGCGITLTDKGSDYHTTGGITLVYTDWVAPAESDWHRDIYECNRDAREAFPTLFRLPGSRQRHAERCLMAKGYVRR